MKLKTNLTKLLNKPDSLFEKFHHFTKQKKLLREPLDPKNWPIEWKKIYLKGYGRLEEIILPKPELIKKISLVQSLENRQSTRKFSKLPLSEEILSTLLYYSAGLKNRKNPENKYRFYPSAGARYPLEIYFLSLNSPIPKGLYHYYIKNHSLEKLLDIDRINLSDYFSQSWIIKASGLIIITAVFKRNTIKYLDRGYRHIFTEAGHVGQNIYLVSSALNIGCCAIGGFFDDTINKLIDIDGINESVIYVFALGHKN